MDIQFDRSLAEKYHSESQIVRILTETWMSNNLYCPHCGNPKINHFPNNQAVADFYCPRCRCEYELKSKSGKIGKKIADGAYDTFIQRITSDNNPDFFILSYNPNLFQVENLWIVPKYFFVPDIVEKRKPLSANAKRAGWIGCNILFEKIPKQGQISIIQNGYPIEKSVVVSQVQRAAGLNISDMESRGWLMDVLNCINAIPDDVFDLETLYMFEETLQEKHPHNHNVKAKIRQQLQALKDKGYLNFQARGVYRKLI